MLLLNSLKDRDERLKLLEEERDEIFLRVDRRVKDYLADLDLGLPDEVMDRLRNMSDAQAALAEAMRLLEERLRAAPEKEEPKDVYPEQPPRGSSTTSSIFNAVPAWSARVTETERIMAERGSESPGYSLERGLRKGEFLEGILRTGLISSTYLEEFKAVVETTEPFKIHEGGWLPAGTLFIGTAKSDIENTRRIHLTVSEMRSGDAVVPVKGMVLQNGNPGMVTKYVDPLNSAMWNTLLPNLLAGVADASKSMIQTRNMMTGEVVQYPEYSAQNILLSGVGDALKLQAQIMAEVSMRKKPVIIVKEGIEVRIQILEPVALETMLEAGMLVADPYR